MKIIKLITIFFVFYNNIVFAESIQKYISPNKNILVTIENNNNEDGSRISFYDQKGKILLKREFLSKNNNNDGEAVYKAEWSSNSQFFVFCNSNSGGHQPWHWPTYFYNSIENCIYKLDDILGPIGDPYFELKEPDIINIKIYDYKSRNANYKTISLNNIIKEIKELNKKDKKDLRN